VNIKKSKFGFNGYAEGCRYRQAGPLLGRVTLKKKIYGAIALLALFAMPSLAEAATRGFATANVNMRSGPSTSYPAVVVIPDGAPLVIYGCLSDIPWCDVSFSRGRGWVAGRYIQAVYRQNRVYVEPRYYRDLGVPTIDFDLGVYWDQHYRGRDFYRDRDRWRRPPPRDDYGWGGRQPGRGPNDGRWEERNGNWDNGDRRPPPRPRYDDNRPPRFDDNNGRPRRDQGDVRPPRGNDNGRPDRGDNRPPRFDDNNDRPQRDQGDVRPPRGNDNGRPDRGDNRPPRFDDNNGRPQRDQGDVRPPRGNDNGRPDRGDNRPPRIDDNNGRPQRDQGDVRPPRGNDNGRPDRGDNRPPRGNDQVRPPQDNREQGRGGVTNDGNPCVAGMPGCRP
jgi:uncharacterized protein YraI